MSKVAIEKDSLGLKWGTLKFWHFHSQKALELLEDIRQQPSGRE